MKKMIFLAGAGLAAAAVPASAQAQDATAGAQPFVGVSAGYHDLGVDDEVTIALEGFEITDSSPILGVVAGVDVPVSESFFAGVEGNYHFGTDAVDSEYGASVRLGYMAEGGAKFYLRGGYQVIDLDPYKLTEPEPPAGSLDDLDDSGGDYLVGAGVEFPIGGIALRVNLDSVGFDTMRATTGVTFSF